MNRKSIIKGLLVATHGTLVVAWLLNREPQKKSGMPQYRLTASEVSPIGGPTHRIQLVEETRFNEQTYQLIRVDQKEYLVSSSGIVHIQ